MKKRDRLAKAEKKRASKEKQKHKYDWMIKLNEDGSIAKSVQRKC